MHSKTWTPAVCGYLGDFAFVEFISGTWDFRVKVLFRDGVCSDEMANWLHSRPPLEARPEFDGLNIF
jgi:hypothetical protein